jgi:protein-disulfide isomerase
VHTPGKSRSAPAWTLWLALLAVLAAPDEARGQIAQDCARLGASTRARADRLLARLHAHDCCDQPLGRCLQERPLCRLAVRLASNLCRRVARGEEDQRIERAMVQRALTFVGVAGPGSEGGRAQRAQIELGGLTAAGDAAAPVTLIAYSSPRGVHCARLVPALHQAVTAGALRGRARLYLKVFPLRSQPHASEEALAFLAANRLGRFWDYVLHAYQHFDGFAPARLLEWAQALGLPADQFAAALDDPALRRQLSAGKREGLENGVESTPTVFIDGRRYRGELAADELVDVVEEAFEAKQGLVYVH